MAVAAGIGEEVVLEGFGFVPSGSLSVHLSGLASLEIPFPSQLARLV